MKKTCFSDVVKWSLFFQRKSKNEIRLVYCYDPPVFCSLALMYAQSQADDCIKSMGPLPYSKSLCISMYVCLCVCVCAKKLFFLLAVPKQTACGVQNTD